LVSRVSIEAGAFRINGTPTYAGRSWRGHRIEGLLFNSRMANAIADDENPATRGAWAYADGDWDAERSTREFIAALPAYRAHGLLAVCLNLSGGSPQGYSWNQPWKICGFARDGTIKPAWAARLDNVIKACDRLGMVVILGLFYGKQSGTLTDEGAVKDAVTNTVDYNEDDHFEFDKADNHFVAAVESGASWGFFDYRMSRERFEDGFQSLPVDWTISSKRKRAFFGLLKEITGS